MLGLEPEIPVRITASSWGRFMRTKQWSIFADLGHDALENDVARVPEGCELVLLKLFYKKFV